MKPIKKIALLHSLCSVGKASLTNMLPTFSVMGIEACPIPTVLLSTHTGGYSMPARQEISADFIKNCANHYVEQGIHFDAIFVGYLGNGELASAIQYFIEQFPTAVKITDPIMGDGGNLYSSIHTNCIEVYQKLCSQTDILLPNFTEACLLTGCKYETLTNINDLRYICNQIHTFGPKELIITDIRFEDGNRYIAHSIDGNLSTIPVPYEAESFHGTGDVFDAVFISSYLQNKCAKESILDAHHFVSTCIRESVQSNYPKKEGLLLERALTKIV